MTYRQQPAAFFNPYAMPIDTEVAIALLADLQIRRAIERGEFDDLPGSGHPIDLSDSHDSDWWFKRLMRREGSVVLPSSIQLRKDDAALDARLDLCSGENEVRREVEEFNRRVIRARYDLSDGPPLVTMPRDVDETVRAWADRRAQRATDARERQRLQDVVSSSRRRRRGHRERRQ
ncbi:MULTISPECIES: DnaJ family domain-containing protein [unclassified Microbacterium]|uniref:DnaJ family domain-containing protein n=1 Tax=unclassified Microbacterium TaxID=2609290 RepID=UPI00109D0D12|nr:MULTISPECIES: DUF1992 domain-containing protein [unclassified Microbacterium]